MLLEFLEAEPRELIFQMHPDTNMPCLMQPILFCLNRSKGTSRQVRIAGLTWLAIRYNRMGWQAMKSAYELFPGLLKEWTLAFIPSILLSIDHFGIDTDYINSGKDSSPFPMSVTLLFREILSWDWGTIWLDKKICLPRRNCWGNKRLFLFEVLNLKSVLSWWKNKKKFWNGKLKMI